MTQKLKTMELTYDTESMLREVKESQQKLAESNKKYVERQEKQLREFLQLQSEINQSLLTYSN